jgi:hypothetical protein
MITINQDQIKELEAFINTIPTAYGLPLLQFLGKLAQEQNPQQVEEVQTEVKAD